MDIMNEQNAVIMVAPYGEASSRPAGEYRPRSAIKAAQTSESHNGNSTDGGFSASSLTAVYPRC